MIIDFEQFLKCHSSLFHLHTLLRRESSASPSPFLIGEPSFTCWMECDARLGCSSVIRLQLCFPPGPAASSYHNTATTITSHNLTQKFSPCVQILSPNNVDHFFNSFSDRFPTWQSGPLQISVTSCMSNLLILNNNKEIWHKAAFPLQTNGSILFARWCQCALP